MNSNHDNQADDRRVDEIGDALRWQLRALRREQEPGRDLWPDIAARLQAAPQQASTRAPRRWLTPMAMAASLLLVVATYGWLRHVGDAPAPMTETLVQREAEGMSRQYQAALQEVGQVAPEPALQPTFDELDRNAALILDALAHNPDSRLLLEKLRRTYARRLALAQRAALT